jgi:hypothetical protein
MEVTPRAPAGLLLAPLAQLLLCVRDAGTSSTEHKERIMTDKRKGGPSHEKGTGSASDRSGNDDRADTKNENNSAFAADAENRKKQAEQKGDG